MMVYMYCCEPDSKRITPPAIRGMDREQQGSRIRSTGDGDAEPVPRVDMGAVEG